MKGLKERLRERSERKWGQVTVVLTTGERQVWHDAKIDRRSPHEWTTVRMKDGRVMMYPKRLVARVGLGPRAGVGHTAMFG